MIKAQAILIISILTVLTGCGPSKEERETISRVACSEIMATRQFEEARRYRILNDALKELGEDPYWSSDMLETNLSLGGTRACMNILNPPPPRTVEEIEQERIAREKIEEELRVEREKEAKKRAEEKRIREEQERIAREKIEEEARIAREKIEEEERIVRERNITEYTKSIKKVFDEYPPSPSLRSIDFDIDNLVNREYIKIRYECDNIVGFWTDVVIKFKNNLGEFKTPTYCSPSLDGNSVMISDSSRHKFSKELEDIFYYEENPENMVESITIIWNGLFRFPEVINIYKDKRIKRDISNKLFRGNFNDVDPDLTLLASEWEIYSST